MAAIELKKLVRNFEQGGKTIRVLRSVSLKVEPGEIIGLVGASGAGKSTLLHVAGLLEHPNEGEVYFDGRACGALADDERTAIRRSGIGFVYQFHHLLPEFTALENAAMPRWIDGKRGAQATEEASAMLSRMGLQDRLDHLPAQLSGGEQQRVAIARALANKPLVVLADEPTGNLDDATSAKVMKELFDAVRNLGAACVLATHNMQIAGQVDRCLQLHDGKLHKIS